MQLINGKKIAKRIREQVADQVAALGRRPGLGAVLVGDDQASKLYVGLKERACRRAGIDFFRAELPTDASEDAVIRQVKDYNDDPNIDAFIVQLPLPEHINEDRIIAAIDPGKDADGFHPDNRNRFMSGDAAGPFPVLPLAVAQLLESTGLDFEGQKSLVVSNSRVFFEPMGRILKDLGTQPEWSSPDSPELARHLKEADILVVAVGRPQLITGHMLKSGVTVIDIGTNRTEEGGLIGDVDRESAEKVAGWLTPVPGGVGPVTVAQLLANTVKLASERRS